MVTGETHAVAMTFTVLASFLENMSVNTIHVKQRKTCHNNRARLPVRELQYKTETRKHKLHKTC